MSTFTQEARRRRIVEAAITCLARDGWHATTLSTIAAEAAISRGLISYHFAGQDDLYESVVTQVFGSGAERMTERIAAAATAVDKLTVYVAENLAYVAEHRAGIAAVTEVIGNWRRPDGSLRFGAADEDPIIAGTAAIFELGRATGEFRGMDPQLCAYFLRRCIDGAAYRITHDPGIDVSSYAGELTRLFLAGVQDGAIEETP